MIVKIAYNMNCEACSMSWSTNSTFIGNLLKHISPKRLRHFLFYRPKLQLYIENPNGTIKKKKEREKNRTEMLALRNKMFRC